MNLPVSEKQFDKVAKPFFLYFAIPIGYVFILSLHSTLKYPTWELMIGLGIVFTTLHFIILNIFHGWIKFKKEKN